MEFRHLETLEPTSGHGSPRSPLTCHVLSVKRQSLFAGRRDGLVVAWLDKQRTELRDHFLEGHKGAITSIIVAEELGSSGLLMTASADRTLRIWDPWASDDRPCIQILTGHGGTVNCIREGRGRIVTASNDNT